MPPQLPFFVYGTLRPGHRNHDRHLAGRCSAVLDAVLDGAALHRGPGYPYVVPCPGRQVRGELVTVPAGLYPRVLAELDLLEDCTPDGLGEYVRERLPVHLADGTETDAWVYLAGPRVTAALHSAPALVASGDWADACRG
ncbi:gamma-glutamylcyclotransferase family protein [Kitasatospora sp. NPDC051914]|uniref:gamma-glutamylcyclotransferase family protein n=1 Tax=unclassified Kitasatospora TaxID=2633591 RepID=UPI003432237B